MDNLPLSAEFLKNEAVQYEIAKYKGKSYDELMKMDQARNWGRGSNYKDLVKLHGKDYPNLPICPYGCGRAGTLLEIVMGTDGRAVGIFNDHPCSCVFIADLQMGEPPTKKKLEIGPDGEYHEV